MTENFDLKKYINKFRENPLFDKYFRTININSSKISVLSFLQHFGSPSPLVDFTKNIEIALYFAIQDINLTTSTNDIENYFSLFFINEEDLSLLSIKKVIEGLEEYKEIWKDIIHDKDNFYSKMNEHFDQMLETKLYEVYLVDLENKYETFSTLNNIRILAQEGLFIHNSYERKPLEEALHKFFIPATQFIGSELDEINDPEIQKQNEEYLETLKQNETIQHKLKGNIITSYEINKSLVPQIIALININKDYIYPDFEQLCGDIFKSTNS